MMKRLGLVAAMGALVAGCASNGPSAGAGGDASGAGAVPLATTTAAVSNMAATTSWVSEERLLPQDPILAMVTTGGSVESPAGFAITCNPDNGALTGRLGMQPAGMAGQSATYRIRLGGRADRIDGKYETDSATNQTNFVFPMESSALRQMSTLDTVTILDANAEPQWAFVANPSTQVSAKYIGSLAGIDEATQNFLIFCNPK